MAQGLLQQQIIIAAAQLFIAPHNNSEPAAALASYFESDREHARILLYLYYTHAILWRFMADELLPGPGAGGRRSQGGGSEATAAGGEV